MTIEEKGLSGIIYPPPEVKSMQPMHPTFRLCHECRGIPSCPIIDVGTRTATPCRTGTFPSTLVRVPNSFRSLCHLSFMATAQTATSANKQLPQNLSERKRKREEEFTKHFRVDLASDILAELPKLAAPMVSETCLTREVVRFDLHMIRGSLPKLPFLHF